ncbi:MAG: UDP-N-acetylglucosamine 2-epimerase (non-hydrolyzing) [Candidatus Sumerlaeales bacterium]|nr:UDP-N-acetylglucosamine 2-epimerase (non-hydrolyzing) [Candidatus Sumerlaeales bacterium]
MKKILLLAGTRPEAIKLAPLVHELRQRDWCEVYLCAAAQHRKMLDEALKVFDLVPDIDLDLMMPNQSLCQIASRLFEHLPAVLREIEPACVIVQGDTTTAAIGGLCAFYEKIAVAHVEAGLRTQNLFSPFPEEVNRRTLSTLTSWHFAPTERARQNLLREGVSNARIHITGNTAIDALLSVMQYVHSVPTELMPPPGKKLILVTGHRRENWADGLRELCLGLLELATQRDDVHIVYPVHPNPRVREVVYSLLQDKPNIILTDPVSYVDFISLLSESYFVITDSGGVQEEAPALCKPVLVTRESTERPEALESGCAKLVGTDRYQLLKVAGELLDNRQAYHKMVKMESPFGDGRASERIASALEQEIL